MDFGLKDKVAIVTGGGSGIAKATVETFLGEGVKVVTADRDVSPLADLEVEAVQLDLLDPASPQKLVDRAVELHGGDRHRRQRGRRPDPEDRRLHRDHRGGLDLDSRPQPRRCMIRTCRAAIPALLERGGGAIVSIASDAGRQPDPVFAGMRREGRRPFGVEDALDRVLGPRNPLQRRSPGLTLTPGLEGPLSEMGKSGDVVYEDAIDKFVKEIRNIPIGRVSGQVQDIANVVAFRASDLASQRDRLGVLLRSAASSVAALAACPCGAPYRRRRRGGAVVGRLGRLLPALLRRPGGVRRGGGAAPRWPPCTDCRAPTSTSPSSISATRGSSSSSSTSPRRRRPSPFQLIRSAPPTSPSRSTTSRSPTPPGSRPGSSSRDRRSHRRGPGGGLPPCLLLRPGTEPDRPTSPRRRTKPSRGRPNWSGASPRRDRDVRRSFALDGTGWCRRPVREAAREHFRASPRRG